MTKRVRAVNVVALIKHGQRFVFLFDDESLPEAIQTAKRYAADPEMPFTWYDAAYVIKTMRKVVK